MGQVEEIGQGNNKAFSDNFIQAYDMSGGDANHDGVEAIATYFVVSMQLAWSGVTGTLDGVLTFQQSNDGVNFDDVLKGDETPLEHVIDNAAGSVTLADVQFSGRFARCKFVANGITGGTLDGTIIAKD